MTAGQVLVSELPSVDGKAESTTRFAGDSVRLAVMYRPGLEDKSSQPIAFREKTVEILPVSVRP